MALKMTLRRADSSDAIHSQVVFTMLNRRRTVATATGTDLPFCSMCGQTIRVDSSTGRCALGHRVTAVAVPMVAEAEAATDETTRVVDPAPAYAEYADDPYATIVYGRSDYADTYANPVTWDEPASASEPASGLDALDEYASWGDSDGGLSALDVDTQQFEAVPAAPVQASASSADVGEGLLDELDDATHARRRAVGTIGATIAVSGAVFASIAALPL